MDNETRRSSLPAVSNGAIAVTGEFAPDYDVYSSVEAEENATPISHYFWILKRYRWRIIAFVIATVVATIVVSSRLTPYYESTATIDIDRQMPSAAIGQDANTRSEFDDADQFLATQVRLIQSDSVLRPVVERLQIQSSEIQTGPIDPSSKTRSQDAPITLPALKITRLPSTYLLLVTYRSPNPQLAAAIANGVVQSYIEHAYNIRFQASSGLADFMEKQTGAFKLKMEKSSAALVQFEKELDVIDPEAKTSILSSRLLQLNTEFTSAQADRVAKEAASRSVQDGGVEAAEASLQGEQLRKLDEQIADARSKFATIKIYYGDHHPEYKKAYSELSELEGEVTAVKTNIGRRVAAQYQQAIDRERMLKGELAKTKAEFDRLNARSFDYKALKQEADGDKLIYDEMIRKIEEAGINSSFQNNSIRLADPARPALKPVFPNLTLNALMAFLASSVVAVFTAIMSDHMDQTVRDPEHLQRVLKTPVIGALPLVSVWRDRFPATISGASRVLQNGGSGSRQALEFDEAIRTLRDSILLPAIERRPRSLLFTSSTPREGKTTTAVHFALAHSKQKRRTLIIDGDMRRPGVHVHLGVSNEPGLSNVIDGELPWRDAIKSNQAFPGLEILPAGRQSAHAMDCVGAVLREILEEATGEYDLIILDSPPVLGFAEPLQIAALADGVVVVALSGQTNRTAVASTLAGLKRVRANIIGIALNGIQADISNYYHYHGYHDKYYNRYYSASNDRESNKI
jgi:polysaccharide biosynthesis transport protein